MMIRNKRLFEFVHEIITIRNEELNDNALWEFWLHKDFEHSFSEFKEEITIQNRNKNINESEMVSIIKSSESMISNFNPNASSEEEGG